ncbi:MAG: DUF4157 domain-containing protein [Desulfobaccales bacterium]
MSGPVADILDLQKSAGNRAVEALLREGLSGGRPVPHNLRSEMEQRFNQDFTQVRLHDDASAAATAEGLTAKAYTIGNHIVLNQSRFSPETDAGRRLLAHELTHVVQQGRAGTMQPTQDGSGPLEQAASRAADSFAQGAGPVVVQGASAPGLACEPDDNGPWWKRKLQGLRQSAGIAAGVVKSSPGKLFQNLKEKYEDVEQDVSQVVDRAKEKYQTTKETLVTKVRQLNTGGNREKVRQFWEKTRPSTLLAYATSEVRKETEEWAARSEGGPSRAGRAKAANNLAKAANDFAQALKKLDIEPVEKFAEATMRGGPIAGVKAWQNSMDEGLEGLTRNFKNAVNDFEDGKFDVPPQAFFDPRAHPTLAKAEAGLQAVSETVVKAKRQVSGGVAKSLWSMGAGIAKIGVHPIQTIRGLGEMPSIPGAPNPLKDAGQAVALLDNIITSGKPTKQVIKEHMLQKFKYDPKQEWEKYKGFMKGVGENYIEAGQQGRWCEIPGLLLGDVGSFLIPGGAATKAGAVGKGAKALGTIREVGKGLQVATKTSELAKGVELAAGAAREAEIAKGLASGTSKTGEFAELAKGGLVTEESKGASLATQTGEGVKGAEAGAAAKKPAAPTEAAPAAEAKAAETPAAAAEAKKPAVAPSEPKAPAISETKAPPKAPKAAAKPKKAKAAVPKKGKTAAPKKKATAAAKTPKAKPARKPKARREKPEITAQPKQGPRPPEGYEDIYEGVGMSERKSIGTKAVREETEAGLFAHERLEQLEELMQDFNKSADKYVDNIPKGDHIKPEFQIEHPDFPSGRKPRVDRLDWKEAKIYEIKPNNPYWINKGKVQGQQYAEWMNKFHTRTDGKRWTFGGVITYDQDALMKFLHDIKYFPK